MIKLVFKFFDTVYKIETLFNGIRDIIPNHAILGCRRKRKNSYTQGKQLESFFFILL